MRICNNCGSSVREGLTYCEKCEAILEKEYPHTDKDKVSTQSNSDIGKEYEDITEEQKMSTGTKVGVFISIVVALILIILGVRGCSDTSSTGSIVNDVGESVEEEQPDELAVILSEYTGVLPVNIEIIEAVDLKDGIEGLVNQSGNQYVLYKLPEGYISGVINTESDTCIMPNENSTLIAVTTQIRKNGSQSANLELFRLLKYYLEEYGVNYLERLENAMKLLEKISGEDGIIDTQAARDAVLEFHKSAFVSNGSEDVAMFFEEGNAVPKYVAIYGAYTIYNWNGIGIVESAYEIWKASTDRRTQELTIALYGQPYVTKKLWLVLDMYGDKPGQYKYYTSLESFGDELGLSDSQLVGGL